MVIYTTMDTLRNSINDITIKDENGVTDVTEETSVLEKFKAVAIAMMAEKQITPCACCGSVMVIKNFLFMYMKNLSKKDKESLICEYGMTKAYYEIYQGGDSSDCPDFWEFFLDNDRDYDYIIMMIIGKAVGLNDKQIWDMID